MENGQKLCSYQQAKDFLMTAADMHKPGKKVPHGAQQSVWMCLMAPPNDHHNEVYQNIILGDDHLAKSADELRALGVTHVVNCACGKRFNMVDTSAEDFASSGIQFHGIAATDIMTFKMAPHFEAASKFMKDALDGGGE
ncbi:hypothetical protein DPMN_097740 [Dreissena polymorpha]|uniref:Dual specificity protein phosphatase n=1 Tax=Dreissena polymorpha TaxID=45954 RepID=A0A9D4R5N7_DREPO|nr:hypothetical protein DPMN_097740 [Dreissena polymorpha]